jgi:putative endonuclease
MSSERKELGEFGERLAAAILTRRGVSIVGRNRRVGRGEIDLVGTCGTARFLVEVRTVRGEARVEERFPHSKLGQLRALGAAVGIHRVDLVAVAIRPSGIEIRWLRDVATD